MEPKFGGRLIGIDPFHPKADIRMGVNEFAGIQQLQNKYDIVLALGKY